MMRITADLHIGHKNIIELENRPFVNLEEMEDVIRERWNGVVKPTDHTIIAGDFIGGKKIHFETVKTYLESLNGIKHLVLGNHDDLFKVWTWQKMGFQTVHTICKLHFEFDVWVIHDQNDAINFQLPENCTVFHGHSHTKGPIFFRYYDYNFRFNVGVDHNDFTPRTFDEITDVVFAT